VEAALRGPGDMEKRIDGIATILERSLSAASRP
jgi:hypothetical protein